MRGAKLLLGIPQRDYEGFGIVRARHKEQRMAKAVKPTEIGQNVFW